MLRSINWGLIREPWQWPEKKKKKKTFVSKWVKMTRIFQRLGESVKLLNVLLRRCMSGFILICHPSAHQILFFLRSLQYDSTPPGRLHPSCPRPLSSGRGAMPALLLHLDRIWLWLPDRSAMRWISLCVADVPKTERAGTCWWCKTSESTWRCRWGGDWVHDRAKCF